MFLSRVRLIVGRIRMGADGRLSIFFASVK